MSAKRADFKKIAERFGIDQVTARIIRNREVLGEQAIDEYLHGTLEHLHAPEEMKDMEMKRTHHINYIVIGAVSMILMLACLTGFIVSAVYGKGINSDINSNDRVWNMGAISMNYQSMKDGVWTLDFKSASDGFIAQEDMIIEDVETDSLYADISCNTVPDDSSITLYLVQGGIVRSFDVTSLSEPLEYPLNEFENGEIHVRLLI